MKQHVVLAFAIYCFTYIMLSAATIEELAEQVRLLTIRINRMEAEQRLYHSHVPMSKIYQPSATMTKEQAAEFAQNIINQCRQGNRYGSGDIEVQQFKAVGSEHVDVLCNVLEKEKDGSFAVRGWVIYALIDLANETNKELIAQRLLTIPILSKVILEKGWEKDVREQLMTGLLRHDEWLPTEWFECAARLEDEAFIAELIWRMEHTNNKSHVYRALSTIPDLDLQVDVERVWDALLKDSMSTWERDTFAIIAVEHGRVDALAYVIDKINKDLASDKDEGGINHQLKQLEVFVDSAGTIEEITEWFKNNKNDIQFNKTNKKYEIKP